MEILTNFEKNGQPAAEVLQAFLDLIDFPIDSDYIDFIKKHNGATGFLTNGFFLVLWSLEDILEITRMEDAELPELSDYLFFAGNGSDQRHGFDKKDGTIISSDFYKLGFEEPENFGSSFKIFLEKLSQKTEE